MPQLACRSLICLQILFSNFLKRLCYLCMGGIRQPGCPSRFTATECLVNYLFHISLSVVSLFDSFEGIFRGRRVQAKPSVTNLNSFPDLLPICSLQNIFGLHLITLVGSCTIRTPIKRDACFVPAIPSENIDCV